jgi:hypothetical protein
LVALGVAIAGAVAPAVGVAVGITLGATLSIAGDVVASAGSVGARLFPGSSAVGWLVGISKVRSGEVPPGAAIEAGGVVGVEDVQPIKPTTTTMPRLKRPTELPMTSNLGRA